MKDTQIIEGITYYFASPDELPQGYLDRISRLVESGGSVDPARVRENLAHAFLIVYVLDDSGGVVACAALKHPRAQFTEMVREQTGLDLDGYLERGYSSVRPEYRGKGIASKMLAGLTARVGGRKLYSIVGEDNIGGQKIALNNNTRKVAVYRSPKSGKMMGIWIPEWMIEDRDANPDK